MRQQVLTNGTPLTLQLLNRTATTRAVVAIASRRNHRMYTPTAHPAATTLTSLRTSRCNHQRQATMGCNGNLLRSNPKAQSTIPHIHTNSLPRSNGRNPPPTNTSSSLTILVKPHTSPTHMANTARFQTHHNTLVSTAVRIILPSSKAILIRNTSLYLLLKHNLCSKVIIIPVWEVTMGNTANSKIIKFGTLLGVGYLVNPHLTNSLSSNNNRRNSIAPNPPKLRCTFTSHIHFLHCTLLNSPRLWFDAVQIHYTNTLIL